MIIREKSELTKMLILIELMHGKRKIREIAKTINITVQGVSEYIKIMRREGLVTKDLNLTKKGSNFVHEKAEELRVYVVNLLNELNIINVTEAIAGEDLKENENVGLFMENGYIHAYRKDSKSMGITLSSAKKGEDVGVKDLTGIMDIKMGKIVVCLLPSISEGGSKMVNMEKVKEKVKEYDRIGIYGIVPYIALKNAGIKIDFEFAAVRAAQEAAHRGLNTVLFISKDLFKYALPELETPKQGLSYVPYYVEDLSISHM